MQLRSFHFMTLAIAATTCSLAAAAVFADPGESIPASTASEAAHKHYAQSNPASQADRDGQVAPRLLNLGPHTFPVSTRNKLAQQFINQGLNLSYAFNHAEAGRAFREAARLDPSLAIAYWRRSRTASARR